MIQNGRILNVNELTNRSKHTEILTVMPAFNGVPPFQI